MASTYGDFAGPTYGDMGGGLASYGAFGAPAVAVSTVAERVYVVPAENRTVAIAADLRTVTVPADSRTLTAAR